MIEILTFLIVYIRRDKLNDEIKNSLYLIIKNYREDEDLDDLIDWIQRDWVMNI